ncbi:MAG: hypothetical protein J0J01_13345 [Reyranella sp.]|nr:hypothetical protein [Reyranella sp.]
MFVDRRRLAIGLAAKGAGAGLFALVLAGAAGPAAADSYCGAGRHVGAENDGAGMSWRCVPDGAARSLPSGSYGGGGGGGSGAAAGVGAAAAGLEGLAALLSIASMLGSRISAPDANGPVVHDVDRAKADARSRDLNRQAISAMQAGRFDLAAELFNDAAVAAWDEEAKRANERNAQIADAERMLVQGYIWEQKGDSAKASQFYLRGKQAADAAGSGDLAGKLSAYNDRLMARAGGAKSGVKDTHTTCVPINGQVFCR